MYAVKENRQYTITEAEQDDFVARGYDLLDEDGEIVTHGAGKTVPYAQYQAALDEIKALKSADGFEGLTVKELISYAAENNIDVTGLSRKQELLEKLRGE